MEQSRLTIKKFAQSIGVSTAAVSRAFGGSGRISDATRKRIVEMAEKMGYRPNFHASSLAFKHNSTVAFFYPEIYTDEPDYFIAGIEFGLNQSLKSGKVFHATPFAERDLRRLKSCRDQILDGRIDGAVIMGGTKEAAMLIGTAQKCRLPYVVIGGNLPGGENSVVFDCERGAFAAGKYFRNTGRRYPAYIGGHLDTAKRNGFAKGLQLDDPEALLQLPGGAGFRFGVAAFDQIQAEYPQVDCVLCANDVLAMGVISRALQAGVKIPEQLAVIGFDDIAVSRYFVPALSTVALQLKEVGQLAGNLLEKQFASGVVSQPGRMVMCDLVLRASS